MQSQQCPNCSAPMTLTNNRDGTTSWVCAYCRKIINNTPETTSERIFGFLNRAINAVNEARGIKPDGTPMTAEDLDKKRREDAERARNRGGWF